MRNLPFVILVLFVFTIPLQDVIFLPGGLTVSGIAGLILAVAALGTIVKGKTLSLRRPSLMLFVTVAFVFWAALSSLWGSQVAGGLRASLTYVQLGVMVALIWQLCRTKEQHLVLLQAFVLGAYVLAGSTVYGFLTNPFVANSAQSMERYTGIGNNPNGTASVIALSLSVAWYLSLVQRNAFLRLVNLVYVPVAVFGIILTASRGGAAIALLSLAVIPLTFRYTNNFRKIIVVVALVVMGVAIVRLIPPANFERIAETSSELSEGNVSNRSQIWRAGLEAYSESPILGVGVGNFRAATTPILGYSIPAHNAYVLILTEMGIVGILLFLLIFVVTLLPLLRLDFPERPFYLILWLAIAVTIFPSNDEDAQVIWALLAIMTTRHAYVMTFSHTAYTLRQTSSRIRRIVGRGKSRLPTG